MEGRSIALRGFYNILLQVSMASTTPQQRRKLSAPQIPLSAAAGIIMLFPNDLLWIKQKGFLFFCAAMPSTRVAALETSSSHTERLEQER
jgi:hypothetical protein